MLEKITLILLCIFLCTAESLLAETYYAANNGLDNGACGSKQLPCRSIRQAIEKASDGDKIIVGPGRYGDLNYDGDLDDEGEERGSDADDAMFPLYKRLKIFSRDGAAVTLIDGMGFYGSVFKILADSTAIGKTKHGFTIKGRHRSCCLCKSIKSKTHIQQTTL